MTDIIQRLVNITSHYPRYFLMFGSSYINISDLIAPGCICFLRLFTSNKHSLKFSKARMTELIFTILLKSISITKTAYSNILKTLPPKNGNFSDKKKSDIFHISAQKHRLWVLVRTASSRRFYRVPTIYVSVQKHRLWVLVRTASSRRF